MNKIIFCQLAKESLLFAQGRARAFRISETQIELWTIAARVQNGNHTREVTK